MNRLKELRKKHSLTLRELGKKVGMLNSTFCGISKEELKERL